MTTIVFRNIDNVTCGLGKGRIDELIDSYLMDCYLKGEIPATLIVGGYHLNALLHIDGCVVSELNDKGWNDLFFNSRLIKLPIKLWPVVPSGPQTEDIAFEIEK